MAKQDTQFRPRGETALSRENLALKVPEDLRQRIRAIPGWADKLRSALPELIEQWEAAEENASSSGGGGVGAGSDRGDRRRQTSRSR